MNNNLTPYLQVPKYRLLAYILENKNDISKAELRDLKKMKRYDMVKYIANNISEKQWVNVDYFLKFDNPKKFNFETKIGLKKLTKDEIQNYDYKEQNFTDPFTGKIPIIKKKDVEIQNTVTLLEHQKKFLIGFLVNNLRCSIVFHGVGTGKTLTAVSTSAMYLQLYPKNKVIFISPPSVLYNFINGLVYFGIDPRDPRYTFLTYDKWYRSKINAENSLLIVDEAHNFRTEIIQSTYKNKNGVEQTEYVQNKKAASLLNRGGMLAHKVILLTATPFVNKIYDIENLLAIGEGKEPLKPETFGDICSDKKLRYDYFSYKISHYDKNISDENFPERREMYVTIIVPEDQEYEIKARSGKENPFYIHTRQFSSSIDNLKCNYIIKEILANPTFKFVCYTTFERDGYMALEKLLMHHKINYGMVTGKLSTDKKQRDIDSYNNYGNMNYKDKTCRVLIITKAGAEGVDLKMTHTIYIMDGQWNDSLYEQIVARAIRYKSHEKAPIKERFVYVKKMFVCYNNESKILKSLNDGRTLDYRSLLNSILEARADEKQLNKLQNGKISNKSHEDFVKKIEKFATLDYDVDELTKLKKGSTERKNYLENNKSFAKNKEKYLTQEMQTLLDALPSTDFYMFILQKNKQLIIDSFIKELHMIPSTEKSIFDFDFGKKIFEDIQQKKINGIQMVKLLYEHYQKSINAVSVNLKFTLSKNNSLNTYIEQKQKLSALQKQKNIAKIGQEYFTPIEYANALIKLSKIEIDNKKIFNGSLINILEPSAGQGGLIYPLLELIKKNLFLKIDMVEFAVDNRKYLTSLCEKIPDILHLEKTSDFLEFTPNKTYHYIFMNPPFHLDKRINKKYKKDYYDYDFVKRAYAMLELNGVIVAITGRKWKENPDIVKWYDSKQANITDDTVKWEGDNLKIGTSIKALELSFIFIRKLNNDPVENNELLKIDDFNKDVVIEW